MRPFFSKAIAMALFVLIPAFASATALDQLKSFSTNARSAKGEFSQGQVKGGDKARITNLASGTFIFSRPGKFIWTYKKPYEQVLQADGTNLYIYDKDLNQVTVKKTRQCTGFQPCCHPFRQ